MNRFLFGVVVLSLLLLGCTQQPPATGTSDAGVSSGADDAVAAQRPATEEQTAPLSQAEVEADLADCIARHVQDPPYSDVGIFTVGTCHASAVKNSRDSTYCNRVLEFPYETEEAKVGDFDKCVLTAGNLRAYSSAADCEALELVSGRDTCFSHLARLVRNPEFCSRIVEDAAGHNSCYALLAELLEDPSLCAEIDGNQGPCYAKLAVELGDASLCDFEASETSQEYCRRNVARSS